MAQQALDPQGGTSPLVSVRLVTADAQRLQQLASQRGVTRATVIRELIHQALATEQDTSPPGG